MAFLRFAQDALIRFDMALLAAALHGFRFAAFGSAGETAVVALGFLRFAQYAFIRLPIAAFSAAVHWCCFRLDLGVAVVLGFALAFRLRFGLG